MNKLAWTAAIVVALASGSLAAQDRTDSTGCGLGTVIWEGKSGEAPQILAVTTNATSGNQTFGITTGTLGCNQKGTVNAPEESELFTDANLDGLARDMARGQGETLASLAELMGIEDQDQPTFFAATQENFARIFPSDDVTAHQVIVSLYEVMAEDARLSRYAAS
jgi:hypothetical protein